MVFINRVINPEKTADPMLTFQYDPEKQEFYTRGREYTFDAERHAHVEDKGRPNAGQPR